MKYNKSITILIITIAVLSVITCYFGLFTNGGGGEYSYTSIRDEVIKIYGSGLYKYESIDQRLALIVQDWITLLLAVPLISVSLWLSQKGSLKGRLLLTGTTAYFLYTYITYAFLRMYNPLFLVYVLLMSISLLAFILCMMSFDLTQFKLSLNEKMPVKFLGIYQIVIALGLISVWLPPIAESLIKDVIPINLDHYNTLGYEVIDLGIMVPFLLISAYLIMKKVTIGYLLSSVLIMQSIMMNLLISVLTFYQIQSGMEMPVLMIVMFPVFTLITAYCSFIIFKNIKKEILPEKGLNVS